MLQLLDVGGILPRTAACYLVGLELPVLAMVACLPFLVHLENMGLFTTILHMQPKGIQHLCRVGVAKCMMQRLAQKTLGESPWPYS